MTCIRCHVTFEGNRYLITRLGEVLPIDRNTKLTTGDALPEAQAKLVRREASRQRRNRNARERNNACRDLGLVKTRYGWE